MATPKQPQPINLDDLTLGQAKELARQFPLRGSTEWQAPADIKYGYCVVVLDRGFVYVGDATKQEDTLLLLNARNVRVWGTKKGLHQLVNSGPLSDTKLDEATDAVVIPWRAVISMHQTKEDLWKKS